jgi:hypothetical protein
VTSSGSRIAIAEMSRNTWSREPLSIRRRSLSSGASSVRSCAVGLSVGLIPSARHAMICRLPSARTVPKQTSRTLGASSRASLFERPRAAGRRPRGAARDRCRPRDLPHHGGARGPSVSSSRVELHAHPRVAVAPAFSSARRLTSLCASAGDAVASAIGEPCPA